MASESLLTAQNLSQYSQVEEELAARTERSAAYVEELYSGRLRYRGKVHRTIGRHVRNAQHEILVFTSMETENKYADDRKRKALLRMYRSAVLRHKHDAFTYTRVIEVQIPDKAEQSEVTEGYLRAQLQRLSSTTASHCTWALQFSQKLTPGVPIDDPHPVIDIVAMPMKLPVTLILIDHRYVVIMTEAVAQDGNRYLGSALIVEDTTGRTRSLGSLYHRYFDTFVEVAYQIKESDLPDKKARKAADTQSSKE